MLILIEVCLFGRDGGCWGPEYRFIGGLPSKRPI